MKYRSYNSELLIATTLMCNVFNDIIIDRRKRGDNIDYSKGITLKDIVQQKIEVPCILGDRNIILKSLENEPGRYKLPLIIVNQKDIKTDTSRVCDIHADVFYQQDNAFSTLDETDKYFRPSELSKRRGQPITINYDVVFITKYREDLDQIISNFAVHFKPDIYLRWWHPRIKTYPLDSQMTWSQSVSFDSNTDYNPQNVFVYKGTTSFSLKSWLFFGMPASDNEIKKELESVIKRVKFYPRKVDNENGNVEDVSDSSNEDDIWSFGDIENKDKGTFSMWSVDQDQEFVGIDSEKMKNGDYAVNNVFSDHFEQISGNSILSGIKTNSLVGDFFSLSEKLDNKNYKKYQSYLELGTADIVTHNQAFIKNVYYKGSFDKDLMYYENPSGDFMFKKFFRTQKTNDKIISSEFGESFAINSEYTIDYDIVNKNLIFRTEFENDDYCTFMKSVFGQSGSFQEFELKSKSFTGFNDFIAYSFRKEFDASLNVINDKTIENKHNIITISEKYNDYKQKLIIEDPTFKRNLQKIPHIIKRFWDSINLVEKKNNLFKLEIRNTKWKKTLEDENIDSTNFLNFNHIKTITYNNINYLLLINRSLYIILKENSEDEYDIYDFNVHFPLKFMSGNALIYEIDIPQSRELLGLNFYMGI